MTVLNVSSLRTTRWQGEGLVQSMDETTTTQKICNEKVVERSMRRENNNNAEQLERDSVSAIDDEEGVNNAKSSEISSRMLTLKS